MVVQRGREGIGEQIVRQNQPGQRFSKCEHVENRTHPSTCDRS
jgi:hypothetical protein